MPYMMLFAKNIITYYLNIIYIYTMYNYVTIYCIQMHLFPTGIWLVISLAIHFVHLTL